MVTKQKKSVGEKILCQRINRYFLEMRPEGSKNILNIV